MSGFGALQAGTASAQPKQISNRLLNMKFMQRAAASSTEKDPSTPAEPRAKRRRTGDFAFTARSVGSPATPSTTVNTPTYGDRTTMSGAFAGDEYIRRGTNNFETPGFETEWVLNVRLSIPNATFNGVNPNHEDEYESEEEEDDDSDDIWSSTEPRGRQTYGSFEKKRKTTVDANVGGTSAGTPASTSHNEKKRSRADDLDDGELSPVSSDPGSDDESEGEIQEDSPPRPKKKGAFDFNSEADLKRMDSIDFSKSGFDHGFGRQRHGLAGKGAQGSPRNQQRTPKALSQRPKKKMRKTM